MRGATLTTLQLPFNGWDELPHIAVAYFVHKTGHMPTPRTPMPRELVPFITAHPHPTTSLCMLRHIDAHPYPGASPACGVEPKRRFDLFLYEAQHGPLFYHLAALPCRGADPAAMLAWVDVVRLGNVGLLVATLLLWRLVLGKVVPATGSLSWLPDGVLALLVSFSYVTYNFARFANDALSLFLGSAALALYVLWIKPRRERGPAVLGRAAVLGGLTGLAVLAKATSLPLVPVFLLVLALPAAKRGLSPGERLSRLAAPGIFLLAYVAVAGSYHWTYLSRYGQLTGMQEAIYTSRRGFGWGRLLEATRHLGYGLLRNPLLYNATVFLGGWSQLQSPAWQNFAFKIGLTGCALLLGLALVRRDNRARALALAANAPELPLLWGACAAALLFHALHSTLAWGFPTSGPWYAMLALPVLFLWLLAGPALIGRGAGAQALLFLCLLFNVGALTGTYGSLLPQEAGTTDFAAATARLTAHHALVPLDPSLALALEGVLLVVGLGLLTRKVLGATARTSRSARLLRPAPLARLDVRWQEAAADPSGDSRRTGS